MAINKPKAIGALCLVLLFIFLYLFVHVNFVSEQKSKLRENLNFIVLALDEYYFNCKKYPSTEENLYILLSPSSCFKIIIPANRLKNGFEINFKYEATGGGYVIESFSPEGESISRRK